MIKISIIMPVYNAEKYLSRAIDSVINQSIPEWELLLIDDGSSDSSSQICDKYSIADRRIKVIHKPNEGVAKARQIGINLANGIYSIHIDSDDWVESNMLEKLYNEAISGKADIVIADYFVNTNQSEKINKQQPTSLEPYQILTDLFNQRIFGGLSNKLIKTELYRKYNIHFSPGINYCEDFLVCVQFFQQNTIKIKYLPKAFYHYYMNDFSITHNYTRKTYEIQLLFIKELTKILKIPQATNYIKKASFNIFLEGVIYNILTDKEISDSLLHFKTEVKNLKSIRWKLGFFFLSIKLTKIAHKLIKY